MDEVEQNKYVSQLKDVFDSCDTTGTGYLDQDELTELCQKLHLEACVPLLLQTLLGNNLHTRVNFEEFKEGFVAVLSTGIDLSTSEDESSYLEPAILEEVEPKYVRGSKRYGRRSIPEFLDSEIETTGDLEEPLHFKAEPFVQTTKRSRLRRSMSLESVESLKSDEELENQKEPQRETFEALGQLSRCNPSGFDSPRRSSTPWPEATEDHVQAIWEELEVGKNGYLNREELATVCNNIGLKDLEDQEVDSLFRKLDKDGDNKVSCSEFLLGLFRHGPTASTPCKKKYHRARNQSFENRHRTATPSLISSTAISQLFSALDDGTGHASLEQVINMWQEDGIKNSLEILQTLDFNVEEKVNLAELTNVLENELVSSKNGTHQAALTCYKNEIDHLQGQIQQMYKERDKLKMDLDRAKKRNVQLAKEVDDRYATMELLNETKIKHLDQGYKEKIAAVKVQMDKAQEQVNIQRAELEHEMDSLRSEEIASREKLNLAMKESKRLQEELSEMVEMLAQSEKLVCRLQKDLDYMLKDKFGALDNPNMELFGHEERFAEIIMAYEQQCRELRDRNDELRSEMEVLHSQLHIRKHHRPGNNNKNSICVRADDRVVGCTIDPGKILPEDLGANVSIETEIAMEQQRQHLQEGQDLKIQLETKVKYCEREIELMKRNFEKERKYTEQSFKVEISELEDEQTARSQEMERLQDVVKELRAEQQGAEARQAMAITELLEEQEASKAALWEELRVKQGEIAKLREEELEKDGEMSKVLEARVEVKLALQKQELEQMFEQERADQQQAFTKERSETEHQLLKEKLQLEMELKLQHQKELQQLRKATQDEFNKRLSLLEVEHVALTEKIQSDNTELTQRHERKIEELMRQQSLERSRWAAQVQSIRSEANKDKLKLQEEQAAICNRFSIEREEMERKYKEEIDSLKARVKEKHHVKGLVSRTSRDNPSHCQEVHAQPSTNEEQLSAEVKRKGEEIIGWQQQKDELELKLKQVTEESEKKEPLLENELRNLRTVVTKLEAGNEAKKNRFESEMLAEENSSLKRKVATFHQDIRGLEGDVNEQRKQVAWLKDERECSQREFKELQNENKLYTTEIAQLDTKNLQLSNQNSQLRAKADASQSTIQLLNARLAELGQQKEEMARVSRQLQETCGSLEMERFQLKSAWESEKELVQKELWASRENINQMHKLETELESMRKEYQILQNKQVKLEAVLVESQEQLLEANAKLMQAQSQHLQEVRELKEQIDNVVPKNQLAQLQMKIAGEQRVQQLQEQLDTQRQEANNLMCEQQEEYERLLKRMEKRMEEVEQKLKNVRMMLQDKMKQLKEQFAKNAKSDLMLKDLYVENAQLMKALQITEQRQKGAEKKNHLLDEKIAALNSLLRKIAPASLS